MSQEIAELTGPLAWWAGMVVDEAKWRDSQQYRWGVLTRLRNKVAECDSYDGEALRLDRCDTVRDAELEEGQVYVRALFIAWEGFPV